MQKPSIKNKNNGFNRLKGLAAAAFMSTTAGFALAPLTARAGITSSNRYNFSIVYGTQASTTTHAANWINVGNQSSEVSQQYYVYSHTWTWTSTYTTTWTSTTSYPTSYCSGTSATFCSSWTVYNTWTYTSTYTSTFTSTSYTTTTQFLGSEDLYNSFTEATSMPFDFGIGGASYYEENLGEVGGLFSNMLAFSVNENNFYSPKGEVDISGDTSRTISTGVYENIVENINARAELYFADEAPYVRALYTLINTSNQAIDVELVVRGELGYAESTTQQLTSDGDAILENGDEWFVVNNSGVAGQEGEGSPAIFISRFGANAEVTAANRANIEDGTLAQAYEITVPAKGRSRVLVFLGLAPSIAEAQAFVDAGNFTEDGLLKGLTLKQLSEVVNYDLVEDSLPDDDDDDEVKTQMKKKSDGLFGSLDYGFLLAGFAALLIRRKQTH